MSDAKAVEQPTEPVAAVESAATEAPETVVEPAKEDGATDAPKSNEKKAGSKKANGKNNIKFDPSVMPVNEDPSKIRAQIEFYFGDHNLHTDEYMRKLTGGTDNKPVPIVELHKFKRMQRFQPYSAVVAALKESSLLVVSGAEGQEKVNRKSAWDPSKHTKDGREARSVYVKGFGDEQPSTQFDIEAFFVPHGPYNAVRLRRTEDDKTFKGSVFVEFSDEETAQKFLALDPKPQWKGEELKILSKKDYVAEKNELIRTGQMEPNTRFTAKRGRGRGNFKGRNDRDDWKKRREHDQKSGFKGRGPRHDKARTEEKAEPTAEPKAAEASLKRAREDDAADEPPAKKVEVDAS